MAVATLTVATYPYPKGYDNTQRRSIVTGTFTITTGGTYPPGGFPIDWSKMSGIIAIPFGNQTPSSTGQPFPIDVQVKSVANPPSGYVYLWDNVVGNLHIFETVNSFGGSTASGPLLEIGGPISNAIVTDTIQFIAQFARE